MCDMRDRKGEKAKWLYMEGVDEASLWRFERASEKWNAGADGMSRNKTALVDLRYDPIASPLSNA